MINKRLLIKNILSHYDENTFYDKKQQLNLHSKSGKAKFLKHVCALSNSNPKNLSFILVGVMDKNNEIVGIDFYDDSKIQNLVNAYLENAPIITYDNITFDTLPEHKVLGLVTIAPTDKKTYFKRKISDIEQYTFFYRVGSTSVPNKQAPLAKNSKIVNSIINNSQNNLKNTLDSVVSFILSKNKPIKSGYYVFKEQFVICWSGIKRVIRDTTYYSRVNIEFVNEQIKLFYSALDAVTITQEKDKFIITEYLNLGLNDRTTPYAFEQVKITFNDNGTYRISHDWLFQAPTYNPRIIRHIYLSNLQLISHINNNCMLTDTQEKMLTNLPHNMMICYLNGYLTAIEELIEIKDYLKQYPDPAIFSAFKEVMRVIRKLKYER